MAFPSRQRLANGSLGLLLITLLRNELDLPSTAFTGMRAVNTSDLQPFSSRSGLKKHSWLQAQSSSACSRRTGAWLLSILALGISWKKASPASAKDANQYDVPSQALVLDETSLISESSEKYIDKVLRKLQEETGLKVRVICPPAGLQGDRKAFSEYLRPINKAWGIDSASLVIVAEERVKKRSTSKRPLPLMTIQPGFRLQERFQYRLTQDLILGVADKFGFPETVNANGTDAAIRGAAETVAATLFDLVDTPSSKYLQPPDSGKVTAILTKHGL